MARRINTECTERDCYTIDEVCMRLDISRTQYFDLRKKRRGPVEIHLGSKAVRVTAKELARYLDSLDAEAKRSLDAEAGGTAVEPTTSGDEKGRYRIGDPAEPQESYDSKRSRALRKLYNSPPTPEDLRRLRAAKDAETKAWRAPARDAKARNSK